jgi:hypothetical protein
VPVKACDTGFESEGRRAGGGMAPAAPRELCFDLPPMHYNTVHRAVHSSVHTRRRRALT